MTAHDLDRAIDLAMRLYEREINRLGILCSPQVCSSIAEQALQAAHAFHETFARLRAAALPVRSVPPRPPPTTLHIGVER